MASLPSSLLPLAASAQAAFSPLARSSIVSRARAPRDASRAPTLQSCRIAAGRRTQYDTVVIPAKRALRARAGLIAGRVRSRIPGSAAARLLRNNEAMVPTLSVSQPVFDRLFSRGALAIDRAPLHRLPGMTRLRAKANVRSMRLRRDQTLLAFKRRVSGSPRAFGGLSPTQQGWRCQGGAASVPVQVTARAGLVRASPCRSCAARGAAGEIHDCGASGCAVADRPSLK